MDMVDVPGPVNGGDSSNWPLWWSLVSRLLVVPGVLFLLTWGVAAILSLYLPSGDDPLQAALVAGGAWEVIGFVWIARDAFRRRGLRDKSSDFTP